MTKLTNDPIKGTILIVDDTRPNVRLLTSILEEAGYAVRFAFNAHMAFESLGLEMPDLILLDIMMPDINGYELCNQLKADEAYRDIPVIFISALSEVIDKVTAFSVGGVDYITKPFQMEEVLARVHAHLTIRKLDRQLRETNAELIAANQMLQHHYEDLNQVAKTVAQDLKQPLGSMVSYAEYLTEYVSQTETTPPEVVRAAQVVEQTGQKLQTIVSELLASPRLRQDTRFGDGVHG